MSATGVFFGLDEVSRTHDKCIHKGSDACEFLVEYNATSFWKRRAISGLISLGVAGAAYLGFKYWNAAGAAKNYLSNILFWTTSALVTVTGSITTRYFKLVRSVGQYNEQNTAKTNELFESYRQLDRKYQESVLLRDLALKLNQSASSSEIIRACINDLGSRFGYSRSS